MGKIKLLELDRSEVSVLCDVLLAFDKVRWIAQDGTEEEAGQLLGHTLSRQADSATLGVLYGGEDGTEASAFLEDVREKELFIKPLTALVDAIKQGKPMAGEIARLTDKERQQLKKLVIAQFVYSILDAMEVEGETEQLTVEGLGKNANAKVPPFHWGALAVLNNGEIFDEVPVLITLILKLLNKGLPAIREIKAAKTSKQGNEPVASNYTPPNKLVITNSRLDNKFFEVVDRQRQVSVERGEAVAIAQPVNISKKGAAKQVAVTVNYNDPNILSIGGSEFSPFDQVVANAVYSLYEAGEQRFTASYVYRLLCGDDYTGGQTEDTLKPYIESIDKSRTRLIKINITDEVMQYHSGLIGADDVFAKESYLLPLEKIEMRSGGHVVEGYQFIKEPLLYAYAKRTKQILSYDIENLQLEKYIMRSTQRNMVLSQYLLRRIGQLKEQGEVIKAGQATGRILYETIAQHLGFTENFTREEKRRLRENVNKLLKHYVDCRTIVSYTEVYGGRGGRSIVAVDLVVPVDKKPQRRKKKQ